MHPRPVQQSWAAFVALAIACSLFASFWLLQPSRALHAQSQPEALGSLSGTVRNAQGNPLPNITVWLEHYQGQTEGRRVMTNDAGLYQFLSLQSGTYRLRFEDAQEGYATEYYVDAAFAEDAATVNVNGNNVSGIDMTLQQGGVISVTLSNTQGITTTYYSARLYRQNANNAWTIYRESYANAGENGVRFQALLAGSYRLCVDGRDYTTYDANITAECYENARPPSYVQIAPDASNISVEAGAETTVSIVLGDMPQVEGYILAPNNSPLANITVSLNPLTGYPTQVAKTDSTGYFSFGYIADGSYTLIYNSYYAGINDYLPIYHPNGRSYSEAEPLVVDASTHMSVTKKLQRSARITGKVTLPEDVPLSWVYMNLYRQFSDGNWSGPFCYDSCPQTLYDPVTGMYTVTQFYGGTYRLRADGYVQGTSATLMGFYGGDSFETATDIKINTGQTIGDINIVVGATAFDSSIRGQVTADGAPVEGIEVGLFTQYYSTDRSQMPLFTTTTNAEGRYSLEGLSTGYYVVGFRDPEGIYATAFYTGSQEYYPPSTVVITQTGAVENVNAYLRPGATMRGHIRTQNNKQASGFAIQLIPVGIDPYAAIPVAYIDEKSDANGFFEVTGLVSGTYLLRAVTPVGGTDFPQQLMIYYPGQFASYQPYPPYPPYPPYTPKAITIERGQTLEGLDIFILFEPTLFMPRIGGGTATTPPTPEPFPTLWPIPQPAYPQPPYPLPTATPAIR